MASTKETICDCCRKDRPDLYGQCDQRQGPDCDYIVKEMLDPYKVHMNWVRFDTGKKPPLPRNWRDRIIR